MEQNETKIFIDENLPYLELRYSSSCRYYKQHVHDTFSIGIGLDGQRIYTNKNKKYKLKKNTLAIINPNIVHSCNDDKKSSYYMMYLDSNWLYGLQKFMNLELKEFKPFSENIVENKYLYEKFKTLCETIYSEEFYIQKECDLIIFLKELFSLDFKEKNILYYNKNIVHIIKYLENNLASNISLKQLEERFNLNSFHIIRLFNKNLHLSPHQFLLNLRINKSKELLKKGNKIVDVALECGFIDQSHFHRNFLNIVASTPREYQLNFIK